MPEYDIFVSDEVLDFLSVADEKTERICRDKLAFLKDPHPGRGRGDKEQLPIDGKRNRYRLHISRTYTAFYTIDKDNEIVKVLEITDIDDEHKQYGI